jgi:phytoene synthase
MEQAYAHCAALVRDVDKDRYLAGLFTPVSARPHVFALYAFNAEVAAVRERTREPLAAEIRLQWWRDVLAGTAAGDSDRHPVAVALMDTIERRRLPREPLLALIEARRFDAYNEPMRSTAALVEYLRATSSTLFDAAGRLVDEGSAALMAADAAGQAYGINGLLRALPIHASRGQVYLPADLLAETGTEPADIISGKDTPALRAALSAMRRWATNKLNEAEMKLSATLSGRKAAFLPLALVRGYLERMERPDYQPFRTPVELPQWRRQWTIWRAARRAPYA